MANMSYCRFENTYSDLVDCIETFRNEYDGNPSKAKANLSIREWPKFKALMDLIFEVAEDHSEYWEEEIDTAEGLSQDQLNALNTEYREQEEWDEFGDEIDWKENLDESV